MLRFLLLFCLLPSGLAAQRTDSSAVNRLQFGLVYGQADHEVDFTPSASVEPLRGTEYGVALRYFDNHLVGFQAEVSLVEAGWREELDSTFTTLYERSISYLEVQLLTQFSIGRGAVQPLIQAGPYLAFPLREEEQIPIEYTPGDFLIPPVYGFAFPFRPNYGLRVGAGLNLELGPVTFQAEGRVLIGFNDLVRTGVTQAAISRRTGVGVHTGVFVAL